MNQTPDFENCDYCNHFNRRMFWCRYYNEPIPCNMNLTPLGCDQCRDYFTNKEKNNEGKNNS